jgi:DNA-binding HxlR family transcriptional regulator
LHVNGHRYLTSKIEVTSIYEVCCERREERKVPRSASHQPLVAATALLGRPWTILIIDALGSSPCRFTALAGRLPGISTNLLTERLRQLQASGVVERDAGSLPEFVITYRLTELGTQLNPIIEQLAAWATGLPGSPGR